MYYKIFGNGVEKLELSHNFFQESTNGTTTIENGSTVLWNVENIRIIIWPRGFLPLESHCIVLVIMNNVFIITHVKFCLDANFYFSFNISRRNYWILFFNHFIFKNILFIFDFLLFFKYFKCYTNCSKILQYITYSVILYARTYQTYIK